MESKKILLSLDLTGIDILKNARDRAVEARRTYEDLICPIASEEHLDTAWQVYSTYMIERGATAEGCRNVYNRQKFLLAVMAIFCPQSLVGGKMNAGMRPRIARMFDIQSETPVSQNSAMAVMFYRRYPDFREDCDNIITRIISAINNVSSDKISQNICIYQNY